VTKSPGRDNMLITAAGPYGNEAESRRPQALIGRLAWLYNTLVKRRQ